jgi:hypothetical protein
MMKNFMKWFKGNKSTKLQDEIFGIYFTPLQSLQNFKNFIKDQQLEAAGPEIRQEFAN